jgi:hypothetical protein
MTVEELTLVQAEICSELGKPHRLSPKFVEAFFRPGHLLIKCLGAATCEWLTEKVAGIKPWPETELSVKTGNDIPKPRIGVTRVAQIPGAPDMPNSEILGRLTVQNKNWGMNTLNWSVI